MEADKDSAQGGAIAIVDDDEAVCDSIRVLLEFHDFAVRTYLSGAAFLSGHDFIVCLIVDYAMPGLNGLEVVSEFQTRGEGVPTIMITATADPTIERRAAELGISQVLQKPLSAQVLLNAIRAELA